MKFEYVMIPTTEGQILGIIWYGTNEKRKCFGVNLIDMCHLMPTQKIRFLCHMVVK
jgi:hypothetical protein